MAAWNIQWSYNENLVLMDVHHSQILMNDSFDTVSMVAPEDMKKINK